MRYTRLRELSTGDLWDMSIFFTAIISGRLELGSSFAASTKLYLGKLGMAFELNDPCSRRSSLKCHPQIATQAAKHSS
jgi:hypothetical protein